MLVLGRYRGERLILRTADGPITLEVVGVRSSGYVRMGFRLPDSVRVLREELLGGHDENSEPDGAGASSPARAAPSGVFTRRRRPGRVMGVGRGEGTK